jgi:hypothetical protein
MLEHDTAYMSRGMHVALFQYSVFFSDVHHALARVLQRQGNREEAWMHYHLAKRHDPQIELDPMFREIITDADLEDHPYFDHQPEPKPSDGAGLDEKLIFLAELCDYDELTAQVDHYQMSEALEQISALIAASQRSGQLFVSARLRVIGDVPNGKDARATFAGTATPVWKRMFELAEALHRRAITDY